MRGRRRRPIVDRKGENIGSDPCWDDDRRPAKVLKHVQVEEPCSAVSPVWIPGLFSPAENRDAAAPCMFSSRARSVKLGPMFPPAGVFQITIETSTRP